MEVNLLLWSFKNITNMKGSSDTKQMYTLLSKMVLQKNMNLLERARSMLSNANLGQELWVEAISTTCYIINQSPSMEIDCKIPEVVWTNHSYDYSNLKIFGCEAYALLKINV